MAGGSARPSWFSPGLPIALALVGCLGCQVAPSPQPDSLNRASLVPPGPPANRPQRDEVDRVVHEVENASRVVPPDAEPNAPTGSLDLAQAIAYGLRFNPRLQQAVAQVRIARQGEAVAFAPFLPEANFNYVFAGFNRPVLPGGAFVPASLRDGVYSFSLAEAGIQWTLIDFGRRAGRYNQAVGRTRIEELIARRARQTIAFDVATSYFALLQARAQEKVLREAVERSTAFRRDAGSRREGGTAEQESLFRSDVQVSRSSEELVSGQQAVLDAETLLNQALGRACGGSVEVVDVRRRPSFDDPRDACLDRAIRHRAEIGAARQEIAVAAAGAQTARGELLPNIYARGTVIQADLPPYFNGIVDGAGINLEQPLFAGGRKIAGVRAAEETALAAAAGLRVVLNNVSAQVNLAYNTLATNRERIRLNASTARQARENLRVVVVRFNNGDALPTEVIEAETALTGAEVGYYSAVYGYLASLVRLSYAEGCDLDPLVAAALEPAATPDEQVALPRDAPGEAPIPRVEPPPNTPRPDRPAVDLPPALPAST